MEIRRTDQLKDWYQRPIETGQMWRGVKRRRGIHLMLKIRPTEEAGLDTRDSVLKQS